MSIPVISEQESQFTFGGGYPVKFYFGGEYQYNVKSEEQLETIKVWAFKNDVHSLVCFEWGTVSLRITENGALTSYPDQLFGHSRRIYAELIRINRQREEIKN